MHLDLRFRPFSEQVGYYLENHKVRGSALWLGRTPACLRMLGLPEFPLVLTAGVLHKIHSGKGGEREGVPAGIIAKLPELLDEPVAIFASSTVSGALVVLTSASNASGVIVASIETGQMANVSANIITSAYAKDREAWALGQVRAGRLRYADEKKGFNTLEVSGHTLNREAEPGSRNPSEITILVPDDLRNYRAEQRAKRLDAISQVIETPMVAVAGTRSA